MTSLQTLKSKIERILVMRRMESLKTIKNWKTKFKKKLMQNKTFSPD